MVGNYALDTNIIIALFAKDPAVLNRLAQGVATFVPHVVIGELYHGAYKSNRAVENLSRIDDFIVTNTILSGDSETAKYYGLIKDRLRRKGRPIPDNDIWIAASAMQHNLILFTRDAHFGEVETLQTEIC